MNWEIKCSQEVWTHGESLNDISGGPEHVTIFNLKLIPYDIVLENNKTETVCI